MNPIKKSIIQIIMIVFLVNSAYGFPGMTANDTTGNVSQDNLDNTPQVRDLNNTTVSDQDIVLLQHLIEIDPEILRSENKLSIKETLIFRNMGSKDFLGSLRTWIPDSGENIRLNRSEMMTTGEMISIPFTKNGNILSWDDYVEKNSQLPFLYVVEYYISTEPAGKSSGSGRFSKKLVFPTFINYRYQEIPDLATIVVKITNPSGYPVKFFDENGNAIVPGETEENNTIFRFSSPQFKEIDVKWSKSSIDPSVNQGYAYVVLGILVILVLLYPVIKKKFRQVEQTEETSGADDESPEEEHEPSVQEEETESPVSSISHELEGKSKYDLENLRKELLAEVDDLENEYKAGNLLDEEYEEARSSYRNKLKSIDAGLK